MAASFLRLELYRNNKEVLYIDFTSADKLLVVIPNAKTSNEIYVCKSTEKQVLSGGVVINTGMSTSELVEIPDGYDVTIILDGSITCAEINSAFANGDTVSFKFTEGDLVLAQSDVETASANYAALSSSGNGKIESLFGLSNVSKTEIYLDDTAQSVDIVIAT